MNWINRATPLSLRLCNQKDDIHTEISLHHGKGCLFVEVENTREGKRLNTYGTTAKSLLKDFPDLERWHEALNGFEKMLKLEQEVKQLKKEKYELTKENDVLKNQVRSFEKLNEKVV